MLGSRSRSTSDVRTLDDGHLPALRTLLRADPFVNAVVAARVEAIGSLEADRLGGEMIGLADDPSSACFWGGALLPVGGDPASWTRFAEHLGTRPRLCASIIARVDAIEVMWPVLTRSWGPARIIRSAQPLLVIDHRPDIDPDPQVRAARVEELDRYLPAAAAMFAEELEASAYRNGGRAAYRRRLEQLILSRRAFVRFDAEGEVMFKAEFAAVSSQTCQIQGIWVRPDLRGQGIGLAAVSALIGYGLRQAPTVSLYVNDFNTRARRLYDRLGMQEDCMLASVLF